MAFVENNKFEWQIYTDAFKFYDTHGLPLSTIVTFLRNKGFLIDWNAFVQDAKNAGWSFKKVNAIVEEARKECREDSKMDALIEATGKDKMT